MSDKNLKLLKAAAENNYQGLLEALDEGANVNSINSDGETSLMLICANDWDSKFCDFFEKNSATDTDEDHGKNILKVLNKLFSCGADLYFKNDFGQNALFYASSSNGTSALKWLLHAGDFNLNETDMFQNTLLNGRQFGKDGLSGMVDSNCDCRAILMTHGAKTELKTIGCESFEDHICNMSRFTRSFKFLELEKHVCISKSISRRFFDTKIRAEFQKINDIMLTHTVSLIKHTT